jgi:AraC family transcriptional regulator of adaptative response/methylated-DNA-[protein]-cysteine methyltransferase
VKDSIVKLISMTQKEYKGLDKNLEILYGYGTTLFGKVMLAFTTKGVCFLAFGEDEEKLFAELKKSWKGSLTIRDDKRVNEYLKDIFMDKKKVKLFVKGTDFQIDVWRALLNIPASTLTSYQNIANSIGRPKAYRAVANAIGSNDIAYLIPCHRVIGKSGAISGYRWGVDKKKMLQEYEAMKLPDAKQR